MAIVLVGMAYEVEDDPTNPIPQAMAEELVTSLIVAEAPELESLEVTSIRPIKVWASAEPTSTTRDAHLNYLNLKAQVDPEFGFTVTGKRIQNEALEAAQAELVKKLQEGFDATEVTDAEPGSSPS